MNKNSFEPIAVVGIGCRFPGGADNPQSYWQLLSSGANAIDDVPEDRWDINALYSKDTELPGKTYATQGGFLSQIDQFDPEFFKIMPREAAHIDPQQRLLLETAYEAMADAGELPEQLSCKQVGVFVGLFIHDYQHIQLSERNNLNAHTGTGTAMSIAANRLSYAFNFSGPSMAVDTACSSSLLAIHLACQSINNGECDSALAGGVNVIIKPEMTIAMSKASMLSPDGRCFSFDSRANGYVRGEGAGVILLKPLSQALEDNDSIYSVIIGSACNQDGRTIGISVPNGSAQEELLQTAIKRAGVQAKNISYVEAHGTGTPVGDPIEANALGHVLAKGRKQDKPCVIGSVKSNMGHLESASGVAGLVKTALMLKKGKIPANLNFKEANPKIDFNKLKLRVPTQLEDWQQAEPKIAGVNSFGFGGTNVHILLQEAPINDAVSKPINTHPNIAKPKSNNCPYIIKLAAHTPEALNAQADQLIGYIEEHQPALSDLAYTRAVRCSDYDYRKALTVSDTTDLIEQLKKVATDTEHLPVTINPKDQHKPLFVFTGMGNQWWAMGRELMKENTIVQKRLQRCDRAFKPLTGWSLIEELQRDESTSRIHDTTVAQPAIFSIQIALWEYWKSVGVIPGAIIGHSVGEVAGSYAAGILSFEDAVSLCYHRSQLQSRTRGTGTMLAVGLPEEKLIERFQKELTQISIAAVNSPGNVTLSGDSEVLNSIAQTLEKQDIFARFLKVEVPYHSVKMEHIKEDLLVALAHLKPKASDTPFFSTVSAREIDGTLLDANYWWKNVREPVRFSDALINWCSIFEDGQVAPIVEIGSHPVLSNAIRECLDVNNQNTLLACSLRREQPEEHQLCLNLAKLYEFGFPVDWKNIYPTGHFLKLPLYPWQRIHCWAESEDAVNARRGYAAQTVMSAKGKAHPLLGAKLDLASQLWNQVIDINTYSYLVDHKIQDEIVFPGAGFIEMACNAVEINWPEENCIIDDLQLMKALFISSSERSTIQLVLDNNNAFTVSSQAENQDGWQQHCRGVVRTQKSNVLDSYNLTDIQQRCTRSIPTDYLYTLFQQIGFNYGPAFQGIVEMMQGQEECLAKIKLIDDENNNDYSFHPTWLDASLHSIFGCLSLESSDASMRGQAYLPVSIDRCHLLKKPKPGFFWSHARITKRNKHSFFADVTVINESQEPVLFIHQLRCEAIDYSNDPINKHALEWLYRYEWQEQGAAETVAQKNNTWLIFTNQESDFLEDYLLEQQQDSIQVKMGNHYQKLNDSQYQINPLDQSHYTQLFEDLQDHQQHIENIIYGFSFAHAEPENIDADVIMSQQNLGFGSVIYLLQSLSLLSEKPKALRILTCNTLECENTHNIVLSQTPLVGLVRVLGNEHPDIHSKLIDLNTKPSIQDLALLYKDLLVMTAEEEVVIKSGKRFVRRLNRWQDQTEKRDHAALDTPYKLTFMESGDLESVAFQAITSPQPKPNEVMIKTSKAALNFKDVLKASGLFPIDLMEENLWSGESLGMECSGIIEAVGSEVKHLSIGQRVMALAPDSMRSHTVTNASLVVPISSLSDQDAAAMPMVYLTAYCGLIELARLLPGERVLIHAAAGGVGQAAIQLAQWIGAEIFVTVGSLEKKEFLSKCGVNHIYNSRSSNFVEEILADTNGEGVDVVLNSLAGPLIDLSFSLLRDYGRFIEIGKMDINRNKSLGMKPFHYNLSFFALDLDRMLQQKPEQCGDMLTKIHQLYHDGHINPLSSTVYDTNQVTKAFKSMLSGEHIGKLVLSFDNNQSPLLTQGVIPLFKSAASYLITGGLGGFGSSLAHWLIDRGAKHLYLSGRSGAVTPESKILVELLEAKGAAITVIQADVSNTQDIEKIAQSICAEYPLKGIFHAAGILDDALLLKQNMDKYNRVAATKIRGTLNLHHLSQNYSLDQFVMFSSVATTLGNQGSGNYASVNGFMDSLAHYRQYNQQAALSVNWGVIADVGMAADEDFYRRSLEENGLRALHSKDGLDLMGLALCKGETQLTVSPVDWEKWLRFNPAGKKTRFEKLLDSHTHGASVNQSIEQKNLKQKFIEAPKEDIFDLALTEIQQLIAKLFGFDSKRLLPEKSLTSLGMDSLMAVELKAKLDRLGIAIPVATLLRDISIAKIVDTLLTTFDLSDQQLTSNDNNTEHSQSEWIVTQVPRPEAKYRMFCFPYAGAGPIVFQEWNQHLSPEIEICAINLPGRSIRIGEPPLTRVQTIVDQLALAIDEYLDKPFIFFGHCMGAIVMHEVAAILKATKNQEAEHMFVSGCMAPHLYNAPMVYQLKRQKFLDVLDLISFTNTKALHQDKEILDLMEPMLRADFEAVANYCEANTSDITFSTPITGFAARQDLFAAPVGMQGWQQYTSSNFELNMLEGDHYFIEHRNELLIGKIHQKLGIELAKPVDLSDLRLHQLTTSRKETLAESFKHKIEESIPLTNVNSKLLYWLNGYNPNKKTLFYFPGAWELASTPEFLPKQVNDDWQIAVIQYPGHGLREDEACVQDMEPVLNELYLLLKYVDQQFAFVGHCFGSIVQYELAQRLKLSNNKQPDFIMASGAVSPKIYTAPNGHLLNDKKIIELLDVIDCPLVALLRTQKQPDQLMSLIRSDLKLMATYHYEPGVPLDCPIIAIAGKNDLWTYPLQIESWHQLTTSSMNKTIVHEGNHFLTKQHVGLFHQAIEDQISTSKVFESA